MTNELYRVTGTRYVSYDPVRGEPGGTDYTKCIVAAGCEHEAKAKALAEMNSGRYRYEIDDKDIKKLQRGAEVSLEARIDILKEFFTVVE